MISDTDRKNTMSDDAIGRPGKILAVHLNYPSRAAQRGRVPAQPSYFLKPSSSVAASGDALERPAGAQLLAFEGEIALIIGTPARRVTPESGWSHVSGVTAGNDFGIYDLRTADKGSNLRSKGGDGFTPLGPSVLPAGELDPANLRVRTWVDGELVQEDTTATLLFPFGRLIADLSQLITLEPGDVILTGTPAGSSVVVPGQIVEVEVDVPGGPSTGRLVTPIVEGAVPFGDYGSAPVVDDTQREEAWGSRTAAGLPEAFELTEELRDRLLGVAVATLSVQLRQRGYDDVSIDGVAPNRTGDAAKFAGRARTLRYVPFRPDLFAERGGGFNAQKRLFDTVQPGEVIVMEARGDATAGTVGDVLALRAQVRGAVAIVTDGAVRDADVVAGLGIPTLSRGAHPSVLGRRHIPWDTDVTIACGGATVQPGDVIVGDGDGAIVIPPALVGEVLAAAEQQEREEEFIARQVREGASVDGLFPMNAEWRARYEEETR
jgi:2-keto-4-pentenoate hydratase/2-oxohepta-3-ene-1,7-dioic acid hydratase in catechol pathway/regulator of RNase E activity RraA